MDHNALPHALPHAEARASLADNRDPRPSIVLSMDPLAQLERMDAELISVMEELRSLGNLLTPLRPLADENVPAAMLDSDEPMATSELGARIAMARTTVRELHRVVRQYRLELDLPQR